MGSIHERLQNLQEAREFSISFQKQADSELVRRKSEMYQSGMLDARRAQFAKLTVLKDLGVLAMIADATRTKEIEPEWPLSREEEDEKRRQGSMGIAELRDRQGNKHTNKTPVEALPDDDSWQKTLLNEDYWRVETKRPCVTDELTWNTDAVLEAVRMRARQRIHRFPDFVPSEKVVVGFDGTSLSISGSETTFSGFIPVDDEQRADVLEEAFVQAFDNPQNIRPKPNPSDHTHLI